jgi:16S rRNA (cytosine967-C5)-methyltransferase
MTPNARILSCIEIAQEILENTSVPADRIISIYFKSRRYIGSQDRRYIAEMVYNIIRHSPVFLEQSFIRTARDLVIAYLIHVKNEDINRLAQYFDGSPYSPRPLSPKEREILNLSFSQRDLKIGVPHWIKELCPDQSDSFWQALNTSAPFDLRANILKTTREEVLKTLNEENIEAIPTPWSPWGLRLSSRRPLASHPLFQNGSVEVQDEGSQLLGLLCDAKPGQKILDYCAGAGGKSLVMASTMNNKGQLVLSDVAPFRLKKAQERLKRAGVHNYQCRQADDKWFKRNPHQFDKVLIDVPCSGAGTWRRNPDLKIRFKPNQLDSLIDTQRDILVKASKFVKENGWLIYGTCSIFTQENQDQIHWFLENHKEFQLVPVGEIWNTVLNIPYPCIDFNFLTLSPKDHYTDGFFMAVMKRVKL